MVYYILWGAWNECATAEGMKKKRKKSVRWATMRRWWTLYDQSREWISRQASSWHSMSIDYSAENKSTLWVWAIDIVAIKWAIFQGLCARDLLVRVALAAVTVSSTSVLTTMTLDDDDDYCSVITADIHSSTLFLHLKLAVFLLFYFRFDTPFLDNAHCAIHSHVSLSLSLALLFFIVVRESFFFVILAQSNVIGAFIVSAMHAMGQNASSPQCNKERKKLCSKGDGKKLKI